MLSNVHWVNSWKTAATVNAKALSSYHARGDGLDCLGQALVTMEPSYDTPNARTELQSTWLFFTFWKVIFCMGLLHT